MIQFTKKIKKTRRHSPFQNVLTYSSSATCLIHKRLRHTPDKGNVYVCIYIYFQISGLCLLSCIRKNNRVTGSELQQQLNTRAFFKFPKSSRTKHHFSETKLYPGNLMEFLSQIPSHKKNQGSSFSILQLFCQQLRQAY